MRQAAGTKGLAVRRDCRSAIGVVADTFLHGVRTPWRDAPPQVQDWVLSRTGALCGEPRDCVGGMATGVAAVVTGTDRSVFVKAIDAADNPHGGQMYRRQAEIADRLPGHRTIPALLDHELIEIGDRAWQIVLTSARPGVTPHHPWRRADLDLVLAAWQDLRPVLAATPWPESGHFSKFFVGWRKIAERSGDPWNAYARHWVGREAAMACGPTVALVPCWDTGISERTTSCSGTSPGRWRSSTERNQGPLRRGSMSRS